MTTNNKKVEEFHKMTGQPRPDKPIQLSGADHDARVKLIREEFEEYKSAWVKGDLVAMADALADLKYVVIGTEVAHGFPGQEIFDEVHRSNMTKKDGWLNENGKWEKGSSYDPPNLEPLIFDEVHE